MDLVFTNRQLAAMYNMLLGDLASDVYTPAYGESEEYWAVWRQPFEAALAKIAKELDRRQVDWADELDQLCAEAEEAGGQDIGD